MRRCRVIKDNSEVHFCNKSAIAIISLCLCCFGLTSARSENSALDYDYEYDDTLTSPPLKQNLKSRAFIKSCSAAVPPIIPLFENFFAKCVQEVHSSISAKWRHPDHGKHTDEVILNYGYNLESYRNVTTDDGYILTVFRITGGKKSPPRKGKPAVLLHHGLLTASDNWVLQYGDRNLAFKLVDNGYDVWLSNARGTTYSQKHVVFTTNDDAYWDFSFHEMAMYDIPAVIRLMLRVTENKQIHYVGHSMGATLITIALAEIPELNEKVKVSILLAPAIYIGHSYNPLRSFTAVVGTPLQNLIYHSLEGHFDGEHPFELFGYKAGDFCSDTSHTCGMCDNLVFFLYGYDAPQMNYTNLANIMSKIRNVVSLKTVIHFAQNLVSCGFRKYDYGLLGNYQRYLWYEPPKYNLREVKVPTYIFYGASDNFVPPRDIEKTIRKLPEDTVKGVYKVDWPLFNHIDFVVAKDADILVYNRILDILDSYQ